MGVNFSGVSCALALFFTVSGWGFVGKNNTEATLTFDYTVDFPSDGKPTKAATAPRKKMIIYGILVFCGDFFGQHASHAEHAVSHPFLFSFRPFPADRKSTRLNSSH